NISAVSILWYHNGTYNPAYDNQSTIPSSELVKGDSWYAVVQVIDVDGTIWSNNITSQVINIINKPPDITLFEVIGTEFEEFVIEDENISISLELNDPDAGDSDFSYIEWYVNAIHQPQFDGYRTINFNETSPGEIWSVNVIASDSYDNGSVNTLIMLIESRPQVQNLTYIIEKDTDGHFIFGLQVTDSQNEIVTVKYELYLNGTHPDPINNPDFANATGYWIFEYYLTDSSFYNTIAILNVVVESDEGITSTRTFNFTMIDSVAPRVSAVGEGVWFSKNPEINPTNLTFSTDIEEYGSEVESVILHYYYRPIGDGGEGSGVNQDEYEVLQSSMIFVGMEGNKMRYSVTVDTPSDEKDYEVIYWVSTADTAGNTNERAFDIQDYPDRIDRINYQAPDISELILLIAGLVIALIFMGAIVYVRVIRKPEIVGLDKDLVMKGVTDIVDEQIFENIDRHTLGIVVSFFDQRHGPVPIIIIPEMLKDNFDKLVALSDRSFSGTGFSEDFESEIPSSYDFVLGQSLRISVMSFGFALDRSEARGGKENLTMNILLQKEVFKLVSQFQDEIHKKVHEFHMLMVADSSDKSAIRMKANEVRKFVTKVILSYVEIYGTTELIEDEE
ncbi:MAG: hypothetical protein KAT16_01545, partial [Candidatus Heimdallarchaeota archaeon]|nr:hypothetical protein [Candidatus Heimdallarchaeota archaeon]